MQTQNKKNGHIFQLNVYNYQGAEVVELDMSDGEPKILCGPNGQGKSSTIKAVYEALGGKMMRPEKIDNPVGPYSTKAIKKALVEIGIEGEPGILELNGHSLERFFVKFSITEKGSVNLSIVDDITGTVHKSAPREKIKNLLGLFLDPVDMVKTLEEPRGDSKLAEDLCQGVGYDPKPFHLKEEALFKEKQEENVTLKNENGEFAKLDMPQDDWAKDYVDPASISGELQKLNEFNTKEEDKKRNIETFNKELGILSNKSLEIVEEINSISDEVVLIRANYNEKSDRLVDDMKTFEDFKSSNKPEGWVDNQSIIAIENQIQELTEKARLYRKYDQDISEGSKSIEIDTEKLSLVKKSLSEKTESYDKKKREKTDSDLIVASKTSEFGKIEEDNNPVEWTGEKDPENIKTPLQFLTEKMNRVEFENDQVKNRQKYHDAEESIKMIEQSIKDIDEKRKQNQKDKAAVIAQVKEKFPHPGITIDYKKPFDPNDEDSKQDITIWIDFGDGLGKRTINDISEGQKLFICTHILIAGNTGALNILVIRSGHALDEDNQKIIFDIAKQYGYHVILETIISTYKGAFNIKAGNIDSINTEGREIEGTQIETTERTPTEINW